MANKLKNIFSNNNSKVNMSIEFKDGTYSSSFLEKLRFAELNGEDIEIDGVKSLKGTKKYGEIAVPVEKHEVSKLTLSYPKKSINISVKSNTVEKDIILYSCRTNLVSILETDKNSIIYFKFIMDNNNKVEYSYKENFNKANNIEEILNSLDDTIAIIDTFFPEKDENVTLDEWDKIIKIKDLFRSQIVFFQILLEIEHELSINFDPRLLYDSDSIDDYYIELYLLLVKNSIIKHDGKFETASSKAKIIDDADGKFKGVGQEIDVTCTVEKEYYILGQKIKIYKSYMFLNCTIKDIKKIDGEISEVFYGETEKNPVYIAYSGFKMEEDANVEIESFVNRKKEYLNAKTIDELYELEFGKN